jgi:hypothetical protein
MVAHPLHKTEGLPVWHAREGDGYWNPDKGNLSLPDGWIFVPAGDLFVTREVKKGPHWILLKRRERYTATLGVLCPEESLASAEKRRAETAEARSRRRRLARGARQRAEQRNRVELESAILRFLAFRPQHSSLAQEIARGAQTHATPIRSGRVGRARRLSLARRAELAARAYIRHHHTSYEADLWNLSGENPAAPEPDPRDPAYLGIKAESSREADRFLERHRTAPPQPPRLRKSQ